ncbi:hypothetical protein AWB77_00523 [Caballeronia fortuita]|uniref:Uncharacterized protein n=1 Tax=Caballeronia fortuita TaxID=1777138 RepID=A0A157ZBY5_9BURK|nr:hypothetical protein [Caballeronia fortuita]SAK43024.1 hypothetical protein AWB77_00523 [Caballeronia fortuita]
MEPYENIVIGNFLYSLGLTVGQESHGSVRTMCVNLMQQTPLDESLGDLMVSNTGVTRLLEFKRKKNDSIKEETKREVLSRALGADQHMLTISREIHWYIETSEEEGVFVSRAVPYIDFVDETVPATTIERFTSSVAKDAVSKVIDEATRASYKAYLALVSVSHGGLQGSSGGLLINLSREQGLRYVLVPDIRDLLLDHSLVREAYFGRVQQQSMELERGHALRSCQLSLKKSIDRGFDYEW